MKKVILYATDTHRLAVEILLLFLLPILLLKWGLVPLSFRIGLLACVCICVLAIVLRERWSWHDLGFRRITREGLFLYGLSTLVALSVIYIVSLFIDLAFVPTDDFYLILFATFIPISFFQEFLYRGFLMHMLEKVYDDTTTILLYNASLFAILHIIYPFPTATLSLTFLGGLFFAFLYQKEKNIYLVTLSHAILNFVALSLGFFVL